MNDATAITPAQILDDSKLGSFQIRAIAVCFFVAALDGFDTQSIAFVAPTLRHEWNIAPEVFGTLFAAGLFGTMIGAAVLSLLADRVGRKPLVISCTLLFGVMSLACATAETTESLSLYRFVAGIGLGGAIPNIVALVSEFAPKRVRSTAIVATFAGFPLGAVVGGMASHSIIPAYGWPMVFVVGGILPLVLLPFIFLWVPESVRFLSRTQPGQAQAVVWLNRAVPDSHARTLDFKGIDQHAAQPAKNLFTHGRAAWTLLMWMLTFVALLLAYFMINWTPLLLEDAGIPRKEAILGIVALNLGGIIGSLVIGRISDKKGPYKIIATTYAIGAALIATLGLMIDSPVPVIMGLAFVIGLFAFGAQLNVTALAANFYPLDMRSTGIGWGMGVGRAGSFVGPLIGGFLVAAGFHHGQIFLVAAIPAAVAAVLVLLMSVSQPKG